MKPKAPGPRRRAREMVVVVPNGPDFTVVVGIYATNTYATSREAVMRANQLRRHIAREFRRVRRAALLRAARVVRATGTIARTDADEALLRGAADAVEALARGGRKEVRGEH